MLFSYATIQGMHAAGQDTSLHVVCSLHRRDINAIAVCRHITAKLVNHGRIIIAAFAVCLWPQVLLDRLVQQLGKALGHVLELVLCMHRAALSASG